MLIGAEFQIWNSAAYIKLSNKTAIQTPPSFATLTVHAESACTSDIVKWYALIIECAHCAASSQCESP